MLDSVPADPDAVLGALLRAGDVTAHRVVREDVAGHQAGDVPPLADDDVRIERKPAFEFKAQLRAADGLPDHEGTCRADVDGVEMRQLFGEPGRSEGPVTAYVHAPQQYHECHALPPVPQFR